jgi:hypothetical protein
MTGERQQRRSGHTFDRAKFVEALKRRGWKVDRFNSWSVPVNYTREQTAAILEAVVCEHEKPATVGQGAAR